ncbi:hypothetical protein DNH61_09020 [Paenibacillus sambharensis]|uniref:DUF3817 domain-containing protein n=1 Tax=Paenibacillus sambharensis TaxID=1803190 RepID=A0A2W1LD97_9BACL|nr:DUF3817 domain-containing protein [Paenibacillus sambharensis]PZD96050.1 hypothetical protein DNH61_09020 [Paenibacillus sambharensis]
MLGNVISRVRYIGIAEGISFILLLFIAMPLKYWADMPQAVAVVGGLHGLLFVLYLLAIAHVTFVKRWKITRVAAAVASAFVPFGPFLLDRKLKLEA